jgi:hypothetical protein
VLKTFRTVTMMSQSSQGMEQRPQNPGWPRGQVIASSSLVSHSQALTHAIPALSITVQMAE